MTRAGRKPMGPALVEHLEGSEWAKERLEVILATITGQLTIDQACRRLGVKPARLYALRTNALEASLESLEPRPAGRPPHVETVEEIKCAGLQRQVEQLRAEVKVAEVREEIAHTMPQLAEADSPGKKTNLAKTKQKRDRQSRLKRPSRRRSR